MKTKTAMLALVAGLGLAPFTASADSTVKFWYHFDNPDNPMSDLVSKFEAANPGIKIDAQNVPWNSYYDNLYTAIVGGNAGWMVWRRSRLASLIAVPQSGLSGARPRPK